MDTTVPVTVRALAAGGSGVADLPDGRVVFVPRTVPGDLAHIRIERSKRRWALGSVERIVEAGPDRRRAPCPLYDVCGGCQLQHLPYERQLEWKGRFVQDALQRIGGLAAAEPPPVVRSPRETGYRNRMTFTLRRLGGGRIVAGLHALGRPGHIVDVRDECLLPSPPLMEVWGALRRAWGGGARHLPAGPRLRLTLREAEPDTMEGAAVRPREGTGRESAGGQAGPPRAVELVVEGGAAGWTRAAAALGARVPGLVRIWHRAEGAHGEPALVWGEEPEAGAPAFVQVNAAAAALLEEHVVRAAGSGASAVDAYGGAGRHGHALARRGWRVTAIERVPAACAAARRGAPSGWRVLEGTVEARLPEALPADLLVLNPPRAGLTPDVVAIVAARGPARVVYVSCDPATLARDVALLAPRYEAAGVRCFDLFPQTAHVETVLVLEARREP
ncbi:MAG TPA: TRAM domain-containing protein [Longimicrobiales bacterium]|nr:TRAM domain-containing protein [Longimicrobiales bacterium]